MNDPKCSKCAAGTKSKEAGASKCTPCPICSVGKYGGTLPGSTICSQCENCVAGQYSDSAGPFKFEKNEILVNCVIYTRL